MSVALETTPVPSTDVAEVPKIVGHLRNTFETGRTRPLDWRLEQLARLRTALVEHADELLEALRADLRKPSLESWATEIGFLLGEIDLARRKLRAWTRPERVRAPLRLWPARSFVVRDPLGVVLVIAPWNYPVQLALGPLVGAIAAGNCAVVKPAEATPHTSAALARAVEAHLDPDCVAIVEGGVPETTALLAERFDHILYTGNGRVARIVMEAAAKHLTPVTLELGGKSPTYVHADANLDVAARRIVWGKFVNAGQTCIAPDYVLVHASREAELVDRMKRTLDEFYGDRPERSSDYARIVNGAHFHRLEKLLESGKAVTGGKTAEEDRYIAPTILQNVSVDSPVMAEEIFGPILPLLSVPDVDAFIRFVNARPKPLALYVFTSDRAVERRLLAETSSGGVCVNATLWHVANPHLAFGGVGESGMGGYHGRAGFETFSHRKSVVRKATWPDPRLAYPPYTRFKQALVRRFF